MILLLLKLIVSIKFVIILIASKFLFLCGGTMLKIKSVSNSVRVILSIFAIIYYYTLEYHGQFTWYTKVVFSIISILSNMDIRNFIFIQVYILLHKFVNLYIKLHFSFKIKNVRHYDGTLITTFHSKLRDHLNPLVSNPHPLLFPTILPGV